MKKSLKMFFMMGAPFGFIMSISLSYMLGLMFKTSYSYLIGGIGGIISGICFGGLMMLFINYQTNKFKKTESKLANGKEILFSGGANHFLKKEAVGGWLVLTAEHLIFESHNLNIQNHKLEIIIENIAEVKLVKTMKIANNGLLIIEKNKNAHQFVVNNRKRWVEKIDEFIKK